MNRFLPRRLRCTSFAARQIRRMTQLLSPDPHIADAPLDEEFNGPTFTFREEPLGLPADRGFGFFQGGPGDARAWNSFPLFTPSQARFRGRVKCMVSYGQRVLSGYATRLNREDKLRELSILQHLASLPVDKTSHCTRLLDHFYHRGIESDGEHLCLALRLEQASLKAAWDYENGGLAVPVVKRVLRHVLHGLSALHSCGIAHTDLKPANIMISLSPQLTPTALDVWIASHPARVYPPTPSLHKTITHAVVSEQLPLPSLDDLAHADFVVADVSHSQFINDQTTDDITPLTLRPPEVMLGGQWRQSVDVWTLGCLIFTLMTGRPLFSTHVLEVHKQYLREGVTFPVIEDEEIENENDYDKIIQLLMWQITMFTGQRYPVSVLSLYALSNRFFHQDRSLKSFKQYVYRSVETCMRDAGFSGSDEDVKASCLLIRRCLQINPMARPSVDALLEDPWLKTVA